MSTVPSARLRRFASLVSLLSLVAGLPSTRGADAAADPSPNVTINLINRMVERNLLTKEDAAELIRQAQADAATAQAAAAASQAAAIKAAVAEALAAQSHPDSVPALAGSAPAPAAPPATVSTATGSDGTVHVVYIPGVVKQEIVDQVHQDVMAQALAQGWAAPNVLPDWISRYRLFGDMRIRYEGDFFPAGNDVSGAFPNFNAINSGAPFDVSGNVFSPQENVDQDRDRIRLRARMGAAIDLGDGFTSGWRLATGENDSPVTENQSLGAANQAQGGNFSKYAIWLDRGFIKYEQGGTPQDDWSVTAGRFDNPFLSTTVMWADDLGFDGFVFQGRHAVAEGVTPFLTVGAFPVFDTDLNFSSIQPAKFSSTDKWLYAIQTGANLKLGREVEAKFGVAYYYFQSIEGKLSTPFTPLTSADQGNTDDTRPSFAQTGNTYMALRDITPSALNNFGTIDQFQYFGLATPFRDLALDARLDYNHFAPFQVSLIGEFIDNTAFNRDEINSKAVNNLGPGGTGDFVGGNEAWIVTLKVGDAVLAKLWDWNVSFGYRYVESDSVVDGFTDADFGFGGTNLKGYTLTGALALSPRVSLFLRWMSADSIAGPTDNSDIIQFDLNAKF